MRSSRPYVQLDPAVIEQARQMDLLSYLRAYEPNNLVRVGGSVYCTREHDSLKISNGKWYWWSRGFGGKRRKKTSRKFCYYRRSTGIVTE